MRNLTIWSVGHSSRPWEDFLALLRAHGIQQVADVRRIPRSRRHPHFAREALEPALAAEGIAYLPLPELGGRRRPRKDSRHAGWQSPGFRGYADAMDTEAFREHLRRLEQAARARRTAVLCAEAVPWRCHRHLIADALTVRGATVLHILDAGRPRPHRLTPFARLVDGKLCYPASGLSGEDR